ncbi:hypothetical protein [Mediterraneibacter gnavus]|uniref:hypothetical protein n=1 Tax=Mediterraneibacter gnavus TaxID=33038 RepID=UPI00232E7927|nr:hypothetical protein [Mediterraneibacter gnavus]MDB8711740.1 hypothetical protein [Mediterraneibacter gnavus]MDB8714753.1 hypothetical protein [Mediterraneibacter gnavus]
MFSTVKIDNGLFLDGKKLNCVKSYKLEQAEEECIAELTVKMDVQVFGGIIKTPGIVAGSIKAEKLSGLLLTDLLKVIEDNTVLRVSYTEDGVLKTTLFGQGSIESKSEKWRGKIVKAMSVDNRILVVELED